MTASCQAVRIGDTSASATRTPTSSSTCPVRGITVVSALGRCGATTQKCVQARTAVQTPHVPYVEHSSSVRLLKWTFNWRYVASLRPLTSCFLTRTCAGRFPCRWRGLDRGTRLLCRLAYWRCRHPDDAPARLPDVTHPASPLAIVVCLVPGVAGSSLLCRSTGEFPGRWPRTPLPIRVRPLHTTTPRSAPRWP